MPFRGDSLAQVHRRAGHRQFRLTNEERRRLAVKGKALGRKLLGEVAGVVTMPFGQGLSRRETDSIPGLADHGWVLAQYGAVYLPAKIDNHRKVVVVETATLAVFSITLTIDSLRNSTGYSSTTNEVVEELIKQVTATITNVQGLQFVGTKGFRGEQ